MKWNRFTVKTKTEAEDIVISTLAEVGIEGVEIQDKQPLTEEDKAQITELTDEIENQKKLISGEGGVPESNTENSVTGEIKETDSSVSELDTEQVEGESK